MAEITNADGAEVSQNGQFHCLKCGRRHNRSSDVGAFHHRGLDVGREGFSADEAAVGIAFVKVAEGRRFPTATLKEIETEFGRLGFDDQLPAVNVEDQIREWNNDHLIGDDRYSGKHWFEFLANRSRNGRSPQSFHLLMKKFASEFDRRRVR